nr:hypothetical protein [Desulfobulbaceae bacterium]
MKVCLKTIFLSSIWCSLLLSACTPEIQKDSSGGALNITPNFSLTAQITKIDGKALTLLLNKPVLFSEKSKFALRLAQHIIDSTYFLEDKTTIFMGEKVVVLRFSGNTLLVSASSKKHEFEVGDSGELYLDKKIIAITDFSVVSGHNQDIAKYIQEDMTSALVQSGQFNVVEREKLSTILNEIKLSQSGIVDPEYIKQAGNLLGADLILTGTFMPNDDKWNANLRLINTESGQIVTAINLLGSLSELKSEAFRNITNINGDFENPANDLVEGWILGRTKEKRTGIGGYQFVYFDDRQGANGTKRSLAMTYKLGTEKDLKFDDMGIVADLQNNQKRILDKYTGIKFFAKSTGDITLRFQLKDSEKESPEYENWFKQIGINNNWQEISIPFITLTLQRNWAKKKGTNQRLELDKIELLQWLVTETQNEAQVEGTIWIDEVSFY